MSATTGCAAGGYLYRWLDGATVVCGWSSTATCSVTPGATTSYTLETACAVSPTCTSSRRVDVNVDAIPVADCRRRLLELYGRGLRVELTNREGLIERTAGVSAAFLRELLRKAAVFAAERASSSGDAFDLCCEVREKLIDFLQREIPSSLPRTRQEAIAPNCSAVSATDRPAAPPAQ